MAKDRKKLQHIHSSIPDKQPTAGSLAVAEIAVNNAAEQEFLSIKNTNDKVVRFSSDGQIIEWIERKEVMPYVGYVRGDGGPTATSGDTPTPDAKGSYGISNDDLLNNKSELVFKLNQVAAYLTTKHDKVNGAKDMYNEEINPTEDYGVNDGAGFFVDMSRYAMRDGNPSFSGLSATCRTELSGNTFIKDGASANTYGTDTGHTFYVLTTDVSAHNKTWKEEISAKTEDISGRTTTIGNNGENLHVMGTTTEVHDGNVTITNMSNVVENTSGTTTENYVGNFSGNTSGTTTEIKIGDVEEYHSGTTEETKKGDVTETNLADKVENTSGTSTVNIVEDNIVNVSGETHITTTGNTAIHTESKLGLTAVDDILESSEANITITANIDICETAGGKASFYGVAQTNLGLDCADSTPSVVTNLYGETINTDADTANTTIGTAITQVTSANTNIGTATTVVGTADTKITSAKTVINTANTSATTATLSGNTLDIKEATRISAVTPSTTVSGTSLDINECGRISGKTNAFTIVECANGSGVAKIQETTIELSGTTTSISGLTTINLSGNTINENSLTSNTKTSSAYTSANTATTVINTANTSATTATLSGNTLQIRESGYIDYSGNTLTSYTTDKTCIQANTDLNMGGNSNTRIGYNCGGDSGYSDNVLISASASANTYAPNTVISGTNLDITEDVTKINSCDKVEIKTNDLSIGTCTGGSAEFDFCAGFTLKSDVISMEECTAGGGSITIKETDTIISGTNFTANEGGDITLNAGDDFSVNVTGDTTIVTSGETKIITEDGTTIQTTAGDTNINTTGNTNVTSTDNICAVADKTAAFKGTVKTNIGKDCSDAGQTATLNINGDTINESGNNITEISSEKTCIHAGTDLNMGGDTNTRVGYDCNGGSGYTNNTYISASNSAFTYSPNIGISGSNLDISGATTIDISGGTITETSTGKTCIHANTDLNMGGDTNTRIGYNCNGDSGYTNNTYISASSSAFTYSPNIGISGSNIDISGATTIDISGGSITEISTGKTCIHANTDLNMGGDTNTRIGYNCNGDSGYTNNTYISASSSAITYAPNIQISGNTVEVTGTSNVYVYGNDVCISGVTDASLGAQTVRVGTDCGTNVVATGITAISTNNITLSSATINESGTTEVNIYGGNNVNITSKDVCISGGTEASLGAQTVKIGTNCTGGTIATGVTINATTSVTINAPTTVITGDTYISGDTTIGDNLIVSGDTYLDGSLHLTTGLNKALNWVYDDVCNHATGTTVFAEDSTDASRTITIPSSAAHIKRETLSWTYGSVTDAANGDYDPGRNTSSNCTQNSNNSKFIIPKTISDVTDGTVTLDTCLNVDTDICVAGKVSARDGFFQTSDRNAKKNIEKPNYEKFAGANSTPIVKFNYKDDETNRDVYGVIAQEAEANGLGEVVYTDENGKKSVDYTSLMILKIGYLENANAILRQQLGELYERVKNLEANK